MKKLVNALFKLSLLALVLTAAVLFRPWEYLPTAWNPWQPLAVSHTLNPVTRWKLAQLGDTPGACLAVLDAAPDEAVDYLPLADYMPVAGCPLTNVVRVQHTGVAFNAPFTLTCPLLVRWLMFEQQQLQPLALEHKGSRVSHIDHFGTFACRNVYNRPTGRRSQHATASAFDVAAFTFEDGSVTSVLGGWNNEGDSASRNFLHDLHGAACNYFGTVLGPDYNEPHENHFHLDTSGFNLCR